MSVKDMVKMIESKINKDVNNELVIEIIEDKEEVKEQKPDKYEVILVKSNNTDHYYISYKKNTKQFLSQYLQSYIKRYRQYIDGKVKKWCGLYYLISKNDLTINVIATFDNMDDTINFIEEYINDNPNNNTEDIEKCEIENHTKINHILEPKKEITKEIKKERQKQYSKKYYQKVKDVVKEKKRRIKKEKIEKENIKEREYLRIKRGELRKNKKL
jgi:hypothetical protein